MYDKSLEYIANTQTLIGKQRKRFIDADTGESIEVDQITKRIYGQKQFWKVYLIDFLQVLGILDSKQVDVLIYILENTEPANNTFVGSQTDISKAVKVSLQTVSRIMVKLQKNNFIRKIKNSIYQISPEIMMKGNSNKKSILLNYYSDVLNDADTDTDTDTNTSTNTDTNTNTNKNIEYNHNFQNTRMAKVPNNVYFTGQ